MDGPADEIISVITSEIIAELLQENNLTLHSIDGSLDVIYDDTSDLVVAVEDIRDSMNSIETFACASFVLICLAMLSTVIIKTFFTGW